MILKENPIMKNWNQYRRKEIRRKFPIISNCIHTSYLSLWKYICKTPEKYLHEKSYIDVFHFLESLRVNDQNTLTKLFNEYNENLSLAFRSINEIDSLDFHDKVVESQDVDKMLFLETKIHPTYLKLIEAVFANFILPMAVFSRIRRGKSFDEIKLFSRVEELKYSADLAYLAGYYNNTIRNSIAHGQTKYRGNEIAVYEDKDRKEKMLFSDVIRMHDDLVDICNGISLGYRSFILLNMPYFEKNKIRIPKQIMIDELREETSGPGWEIVDCLESQTIKNQEQLNIYVKNDFLDRGKVVVYVLRSALYAEMYAPFFGRYFFSLNSRYSKSFHGWASFDGLKLRSLRIKDSDNYMEYISTLEENMVFFIPKISLPNIVFRVLNIITILRMNLKALLAESRERKYPYEMNIRNTRVFRNGKTSTVEAEVVIKSNIEKSNDLIVREFCYEIVRKVIRNASRGVPFTDTNKYFPVGFARIFIYSKDFRKRKLKGSGLISELICKIETNSKGKVEQPNFLGSDHEFKGKYIIFWNKKPIPQE